MYVCMCMGCTYNVCVCYSNVLDHNFDLKNKTIIYYKN